MFPKLDCLYRITAGDPSRGNISIDSPFIPPIGTRVRFLRRHSTTPPNLSLPRSLQSLSFLTVSDDLKLSSSQQGESAWKDFEMLLENKFLVASENGFGFERAEHPGENVKCSLPGSLGSLQWPFASGPWSWYSDQNPIIEITWFAEHCLRREYNPELTIPDSSTDQNACC